MTKRTTPRQRELVELLRSRPGPAWRTLPTATQDAVREALRRLLIEHARRAVGSGEEAGDE